MDKFNEYEQRQVKNFILLENRDDTTSSKCQLRITAKM